MAAERLLIALALGGACWAGSAGARPQDPAAEAARRLEAGDPAGALEAAARLEDPLARAEWRFHVLQASGDLPGALAAAREGLALQPDHPGLLVNATVCALSLGLGGAAGTSAERLASAARALRDAELEARAQELGSQAESLRALERQGARGAARARWTVGVGLLSGLAGLLWLRPRRTRAG